MRAKKMKTDAMTVKWSRQEQTVIGTFPRPSDENLAREVFCQSTLERHDGFQVVYRSLIHELKANGYDLSTLRFSVSLTIEEQVAIDKQRATK